MSTQVQEVNKKALVKISKSHIAIGRLIILFNVHYKTVERWIETNDVRLTTPQALQIIQEESKLPISEILVDKK